ncbi:MAG: tail fiber domain-containing protein, partial [Patescibacteria group bacterium]
NQRINVGSAGNVGIGTTTPWAKLSVNNYSTAGNTAPLFVVSSSTGALATSTAFIIDSIGNVGIGTTSPLWDFQIDGTRKVLVGDGNNIATSTGGKLRVEITDSDSENQGIKVFNSRTTGINYAINGTTVGYGATRNIGLYGYAQGSATDNWGLYVAKGNSIFEESVGIGTTTPYAKLSVNAKNGEANTILFAVASSTASATTTLFTVSNTGNTAIFGTLSIGSATVEANYLLELPNSATQKAKANAWDTYSDSRIKTGQQNLDYGLNTILQLNPKRYTQMDSTWQNDQLVLSGGKNTFGFIAQDVYSIIPEIVNKPVNDNTELWGMDYSKLTPVLVKAIQDLDVKIGEQSIFAPIATSTPSRTFTQVFTDSLNSYFASFGARIEAGVAYFGNIFADKLTVGSQRKPTGITLYNGKGDAYCLTVGDNGVPISTLGVCSDIQTSQVQAQTSQTNNSSSSNILTMPVIINSLASTTPVENTGSSTPIIIPDVSTAISTTTSTVIEPVVPLENPLVIT